MATILSKRAPIVLPAAAVVARWRRRWSTAALPSALYGLAAALLLVRIGARPAFPYNWEDYTAWGFFPFWDRPSAGIFALTGGLMTDSGRSPLVALPAWLAFRVGGVGLAQLRAPLALLSAGAVPLLWFVGREFVGRRAALLAALLLALSPAFLLYGRTATLVGVSLVPALLTAHVVLRLLRDPRERRWLWLLQALLIVNSYGYAPLRFLWPLSLILLLWERSRRRAEAACFRRALAVTALTLPLFVLVASRQHPALALSSYYDGRGEHVFALSIAPESYRAYLASAAAEEAAGAAPGDRVTLAARLIARNSGDLLGLLLDRGTRPVLTDFWNPHGRLYPALLVPFFWLGLARAARRARDRLEDRALLVLFLGFSVPLVLTSQVHVGRLIFALPFLLLLVAAGFDGLLEWPDWRRRASGVADCLGAGRAAAGALLAALLLAAVARATWLDYRVPPPATEAALAVPVLRDHLAAARRHGGGALVLDPDAGAAGGQIEVEAIRLGAYRLLLDREYRFADLSAGMSSGPTAGDERPSLYYGGLFDRLRRGEPLPNRCENLYFVTTSLHEPVREIFSRPEQGCASPPPIVPLPWP